MAKYHWTSLLTREFLRIEDILALLKEAYALTTARLSKKEREALGLLDL